MDGTRQLSLPARESAVAVRQAFRRGLVVDGIKMWMLPLRLRIHRRRAEIRRMVVRPAPVLETPRVPAGAVPDATRVTDAARASFRVDLPPSRISDGTFRAAGGRRVPFPGEGRGREFDDPEDAHAWNRLGWALEPGQDDRILAELSGWLESPLSETALNPYTTSERICALAQVLGTLGERLPNELARLALSRLLADAESLADSFETRLGVHNHLLNNARALCVAGRLAGDGRRASLWLGRARETWDAMWPKLILDDGVFAEQSSHYHVLLTRTLLEYVRDAREAKRALPAGMDEKARAMCRVTNALVRSDGTLPLFGDLSPDVPTSWLRGLPRVARRAGLLDEPLRDEAAGYAAGASALFREASVAGPAARAPRADGWRSTLFTSGGFLLATHAGIDLELSAHGDPRPASAAHGDAGRGAFEIWYRGRPIVADGGVPTYERGELRDEFRGAAGQSVVAIDGLAPALLRDQVRDLPRWYVDSLEGGVWRTESNGATFEWRGFRRHRPGLTWVREFRWTGPRLEIRDRLEGWAADARVEARVRFGETGWRNPAPGLFTTAGCRARLDGPPDWSVELTDMQRATDYGVLIESQGVRMSGPLRLPSSWTWSFDFDSET